MNSSKIIWVGTFLIVSFSLCLHPTWGDAPPPPTPAPHHEPPHCYVCRSDKDSKCTPSKPSGDAMPSTKCEDPNKLLNEWLKGQEFMKFGIGSVNFQKLMGIANEKTGEKTESVTACLYLYLSNENMMTKGLDQGIKKARSFIPGDKGAGDAVSVKKWVFRDCITVLLDHDQGAAKRNKTLNRCVPVDTKGTGKVNLCTCLEDKCNERGGNIQGSLNQRSAGSDDDSDSGARGDQVEWRRQMIKLLISVALVGSLSKI